MPELTTDRTMLARRAFLQYGGMGLGAAALASLVAPGGAAAAPHFAPRAKRIVFLHQSGAPSQMDLFDPKEALRQRHGEELPDSIRMGQRLTEMTSKQEKKPLTASLFKFARHGECGAQISELLPYTAKVVDDLCFVRSLQTDAINHDPAITFIQTGSQQPGRPSLGSWLNYGLGAVDSDFPAFVVFVSGGSPGDQPLSGRLWGSGFLPSQHQGVKFRSGKNPVLYLANPPGLSTDVRSRMLDALRKLNEQRYQQTGDPEIPSRISQFELAFRMQAAAPELTDTASEPEHTFQLYGQEAKRAGTYASNCLMARRLLERGVRFVQLYHRGWDHHDHLPTRIRRKCLETDRASAGLVADLKQRGMLDDTLIVWAGEFGRTSYCQGPLTADDYGRDHHPRCFTIWLAGGGVRGGFTYGSTDDFSYNVRENPVHVHDLQATLLHCLGLNHERLTYRSQGRDFRLTEVSGNVVSDILR